MNQTKKIITMGISSLALVGTMSMSKGVFAAGNENNDNINKASVASVAAVAATDADIKAEKLEFEKMLKNGELKDVTESTAATSADNKGEAAAEVTKAATVVNVK